MKLSLSWVMYYTGRTLLLLMVPLLLCSEQKYKETTEVTTTHWLKTNGKLRMNNVMRADACTTNKQYCIKEVLLIRGLIRYSTYFDLKQLFEHHPVTTICVDSPGGSAVATWFISRWIADHDLDTCMAENYLLHDFPIKITNAHCYSACPFVLASGQERLAIGRVETIGVHQGRAELSMCVCEFTLSSDFYFPNQAFLMPEHKANFELLFELSDQANHDEMFMLSRAHLERVKMFTRWL